TCIWELLGDHKQAVIGKSKAEIIHAIQEEGKPMTGAELSVILSKDSGTLRSTLSRMAKEGLLIKTDGGYKVPD
ncbi:MAG TPA: hypothetical protein VGE40_08545, partial [Bacilli bacterium]